MFLSAFAASANPTAAEFELAATMSAQPCDTALELRPVSSYSSMGCARSRDVHFIRHAEGTHNLAEREATRDGLHKTNASWTALEAKHGVAWILTTEATGMAHYDAELTVAGARQAANLGAALQNSQQLVPLGYVGLEVDAVCSSPFRRTLQARANFARNFTAQFSPTRHRPQTAHLAVPALREKIVEIGGRPTAAGRARTRVLASDLLRERVAEYTCDGRLKVSELRSQAFGNATAAEVPEVDYAGVSEEDEMYASGREDGPDEAKLLAYISSSSLTPA